MLDDYQMPLFSRSLLYEELERRLKDVGARLGTGWQHYVDLSDLAIVRKQFSLAEIYPLELLFDQLVIEEKLDGLDRDTREQVFRYDCYIPYLGDDDLWLLDPGGIDNHPEGETFRRNLLIVDRYTNRDEAAVAIKETLSKIGGFIEAQTLQIYSFHAALPQRVHALVQAARGGQLVRMNERTH